MNGSSPPLSGLGMTDDDLSFSDLSLLTTPQARKSKPSRSGIGARTVGSSSSSLAPPASSSSSSPAKPSSSTFSNSSTLASSPLKNRGPPQSQSKPRDESQLRLMQGVARGGTARDANANTAPRRPPVSSQAAPGRFDQKQKKARASLFAPSALPSSDAPRSGEAEGDGDGDGDGDNSLLQEMAGGNRDGDGDGDVRRRNSQKAAQDLRSSLGVNHAAPSSKSTSHEQMQRQLDQLAKMNATFEGFERMLYGTEGQLDLFNQRLSSTSSLLSSYIDLLLRQSEHQNLLLDPQWQGQRLDEEKHLEAMRELEEELERRRRRREQEERDAEQRRREQREREQAEAEAGQRRIAAQRGGMRGGLRGRPTTTATARGGSAGARPPVSSARGRTTAGTASSTGRTSGIPAARGSTRGGAGVRRP